MKAVDKKGREIQAGDTIAYAMRSGSCSAELAIYQVNEVFERDDYGRKAVAIRATRETPKRFGRQEPKPVILTQFASQALVINETAKVWA